MKYDKQGLSKANRVDIAQRQEGEQKADELITRMKNAYGDDVALLNSGGLANRKIVLCKDLERELRNVRV